MKRLIIEDLRDYEHFVPIVLDIKKKHIHLISEFFLPEEEMCDQLANPEEEEIK